MNAPVRFDTKSEAITWIEATKGEIANYFTTTFVSDHYAKAYGVETGGWYVCTHAAGMNCFEKA